MADAVERPTNGLAENQIARRVISKQPRFALEPVGVGVGRLDSDGRWLLASRGLCRMLGYRRGELLKTTIKRMTSPDDWPHQKEALERIISGSADSCTLEKRYICKSSLPLWVTETCSAVRKDDGSYLYTVTLVEVNERKRTEELFQMTLESSANAIAITNGKREITLVNAETERIFDYRRDELIGRTMDSILPDLLQTYVPFSCARLRTEQLRGKWDSYGRRKDGTFFPVELEVQAIETGNGTWTIISIADLCESKQTSEQSLEMSIAS